MTDSNPAEQAIQKLLQEYQKLADEERQIAPRREAAKQKIDQLVDDLASIGTFDQTKVTDEMLAAFIIMRQNVQQRMMMGDMAAQMTFAKFDQSLMQQLSDHFASLREDPEAAQKINLAARELTRDMQPPKIRVNMPTFDMAVNEPEGDTGTWTVAVVPIVIDENYQAKVADKLDFDLYLSAEVTPHESLKSEFNIRGKVYRAGQKIEPMVVSHETKENGPQTLLHIRGHVYKDGAYVQPLEFPPMALEKQSGMGMDMEAIMRMMQGGPGPNGPN